VLAHALAGDDGARAGQRGMIPSDLIEALRSRINPR
jgi:NAD(P)H-hydrate epimerase